MQQPVSLCHWQKPQLVPRGPYSTQATSNLPTHMEDLHGMRLELEDAVEVHLHDDAQVQMGGQVEI